MGEQGHPDRAAWEGMMFRLLAETVLDYALSIVDPHLVKPADLTALQNLLAAFEKGARP